MQPVESAISRSIVTAPILFFRAHYTLSVPPYKPFSSGSGSILGAGASRASQLAPKFGFVRSLGLCEVWVCSMFGFIQSLGLFEVWVFRSTSVYRI